MTLLKEGYWDDDFKDADNNDYYDQENYGDNLLNQPVKRIKLDLDNLKWSVDDEGELIPSK